MAPANESDSESTGDADGQIVSALRARSSANESLVYAHHVFAEIDALVRRYWPRTESILEIGPGANLGALFCFAASGYAKMAGIDIAVATPPATEFYTALRDYLSCIGGWRWWRQFATASYPNVTFPTMADRLDVDDTLRRIDYRAPVSSTELPFDDGSFDVVFSVASLEHVVDPGGTVAEMRRVLKPGGVAIHEIDLTHHGSADPMKFLEWDEDAWHRRSEQYGDGRSLEGLLDGAWGKEVFCNRLRHAGWLTLFSEGFELLHDEPVIVYDPMQIDRTRFAEPFRSMTAEELSVLAFRIVARRST